MKSIFIILQKKGENKFKNSNIYCIIFNYFKKGENNF